MPGACCVKALFGICVFCLFVVCVMRTWFGVEDVVVTVALGDGACCAGRIRLVDVVVTDGIVGFLDVVLRGP